MTDHAKKVLWAAWQSFRHMRVDLHVQHCEPIAHLTGAPTTTTEDCPYCSRLARLDQDLQLIVGGHEPTHALLKDLP